MAVVALGLQIKPNGYGPFLLGIVSAVTILSGKFMIGSNLMTYGGIVLLVFASGVEPDAKAIGPLSRLFNMHALW